MKVAVFCGSNLPRNPHIRHQAIELGKRLALRGDVLVYGGSNLGLMGAISGAALESNGEVVSIIPTFFSREIIESQPCSELILVEGLSDRKQTMMQLSDAFIAFPGGLGTLDELTDVFANVQLEQISKPVVLLNVDGFFDPFLQQLDLMIEEGLMKQEVRNTLLVCKDVDSLLTML